MDKNIKNSLLLAGGAIGGGYGGSWVAQRVCTAMGCSLGPWGSAIGAMLGAMAGRALTKRMLADEVAMPEYEPEGVSAVVADKTGS